MRYELTDYEWHTIKPFLPNKPRGVPRVNDRRVLNGIFWVLRSGAPWRNLPGNFGPYTLHLRLFGNELSVQFDAVWRKSSCFANSVFATAVRNEHSDGAILSRRDVPNASLRTARKTATFLAR